MAAAPFTRRPMPVVTVSVSCPTDGRSYPYPATAVHWSTERRSCAFGCCPAEIRLRVRCAGCAKEHDILIADA